MLNDTIMVAAILTLVFGSAIFYLYTRLSMTERKLGLFEGVLTDLKIMMDSAPFAYGGEATMRSQFESTLTPEYLNAISGPVPLENDEVEEVSEDYQQTLEQALASAAEIDSTDSATTATRGPYRTLQIDEPPSHTTGAAAISVTKLSPDLDSMTVKELTAFAKQNGLSVSAGTRRKDLIDMLKKSVQKSSNVQDDTIDGATPPFEGESLETLLPQMAL